MKELSWVKLFFVPCFLAVLVLPPVSPSYALPAGAVPVGEASFQGDLWCMFGSQGPLATPVGSTQVKHVAFSDFVEVSHSWGSYDAIFIASLNLTGGKEPRVTIAAAASNLYSGNASGSIVYRFRADKKDPYAPDDVLVPLIVSSTGSLTNNRCFFASVRSSFGTQIHPEQDIIIDSGPVTSAHWENSRTIRENVPVGPSYVIYLTAAGSLGGGGRSGSQDFHATVDPIVRIDPDWMVDYNGNMVPGTQLYSLTFSPGFNTMPLPGVLMLLLD
jgi:hypothetical protein